MLLSREFLIFQDLICLLNVAVTPVNNQTCVQNSITGKQKLQPYLPARGLSDFLTTHQQISFP